MKFLPPLIFILAALSSAAEVHLSPGGSDANAGTLEAPVATLERARDLLRSAGGGVAWLHGGVYARGATFTLGAADSGSVWRSWPGEEAILTGGRPVTGFVPSALRPGVYEAGLPAQGITNYGALRRRGFGSAQQPAALELFFRGQPMPLARWPNRGWAYIAAAPAGQQGGQFRVASGRPLAWAQSGDIWVHGYWTHEWADSYEHVAAIDAATRTIRTDPPHGVYGYTAGRRWRAVNVLEELDEPGEWYLDRKTGKLYFWPPEAIRDGDVWVSLAEQPLVTLDGASDVLLWDLTLETSRGHGIVIRGGRGNLVSACRLRNLGMQAVTVQGGTGHVVEYCAISETGEGGVSLAGGDRPTLQQAGHRAHGNHVWNFSRWARTYRPAIAISGVGQQATANHLHSAPHEAIAFSGNDHLIADNDIHTVAWETADVGAVYAGRDFTWRGNAIRGNYFHNQGNGDVNSVYLDDCMSGVLVEGNTFDRAGRSIFIGGGRDNILRANVILDGAPGIQLDSRGLTWAAFWFNGKDPTLLDRLKAMPYQRPPWSERYPELVNILDDEPAVAKNNVLEDNVLWGKSPLLFRDGTEKWTVQRGNVLAAERPPTPRSEAWSRATEIVNYRVELVRNGRPARVRLVAENLGAVATAGTLELWLWPDAGVQLSGNAQVPYELEPGAMLTREFDVDVAAEWREAWVGAVQLGSDLRPLPLKLALPN